MTDIESLLAQLWKQVLDREEIRSDENFFLLGGDSMTGIIFIGLISEELEIEFTLDDLIDNPSISEFAHHIDRVKRA